MTDGEVRNRWVCIGWVDKGWWASAWTLDCDDGITSYVRYHKSWLQDVFRTHWCRYAVHIHPLLRSCHSGNPGSSPGDVQPNHKVHGEIQRRIWPSFRVNVCAVPTPQTSNRQWTNQQQRKWNLLMAIHYSVVISFSFWARNFPFQSANSHEHRRQRKDLKKTKMRSSKQKNISNTEKMIYAE